MNACLFASHPVQPPPGPGRAAPTALCLRRLALLWSLLVSLAAQQMAWPQAAEAQAAGKRLVLAHYYTWFDEQSWSREQLSDLPAESYVSRDRAVMGRHIDQAKGAGIDALLVAWYGPSQQHNQTEPNLVALLDEAAARSYRIGILFESTSPFLADPTAAAAALSHALNVHAGQPAFLRAGERPVIFFWRPQRWSVESWREIRQQVDPEHSSIWIAEGVDMAYQAVFDGHHLYSNTWNPPTDLGYTNQKFARLVQEASSRYATPKIWVATVMPGYNDIRTGRTNGFARNRENGAYYERSWQAAIASQPDWIVITSFNEWPEGSYIEPSVTYGDLFLGLTAHWSRTFKSAAAPLPAPPPAPTAVAPAPLPAPAQPTAIPTPRPEVTVPTAFVNVGLLNLRAGPSVNHVVLAVMAAEEALPIVGRLRNRSDWWQVHYGDLRGWVFAQMVAPAGPLETVPIVVPPPLGGGNRLPQPGAAYLLASPIETGLGPMVAR